MPLLHSLPLEVWLLLSSNPSSNQVLDNDVHMH